MIWFWLYVGIAFVVMYVTAAFTEAAEVAIPVGLAWIIALPIIGTMALAAFTRASVEMRREQRKEVKRAAAYAKFSTCQHEVGPDAVRCLHCEGWLEGSLGGPKWRFR